MTSEEIYDQVYAMGRMGRRAALELSLLSAERKSAILLAMASSVRTNARLILDANARDLEAADARGIKGSMRERLVLNGERVEAIAAGIEQVSGLPDPVGEQLDLVTRPNGIQIEKVRVPIGVIGIIYESRPNVTSDAAVLCLKSGNATILRGGSEAISSNMALAKALQEGGETEGLPEGAIQLVPFTDRESVRVLAGMGEYLDVIIPRGGEGLIKAVVSMAVMPVIKHYDGICHAFVDRDADQEQAVAIIDDGKTQKCSGCNALETVLVDGEIAVDFLPKLSERLEMRGVEIRGCEVTCGILRGAVLACDEDWSTEYLDLVVSVKVVDSIEEAIEHVNHYGSHHSDVIITRSDERAERFMSMVDSACVYHNVSTRFSDGEEFGFGAEIGISTDKLHARGPMGLVELTSYQYRIRGDGQLKDGGRQVGL